LVFYINSHHRLLGKFIAEIMDNLWLIEDNCDDPGLLQHVMARGIDQFRSETDKTKKNPCDHVNPACPVKSDFASI